MSEGPEVATAPPDGGRGKAIASGAGRFAQKAVSTIARRVWFIALVGFAWWLVTHQGWVPSFKLPTPESVASALERGFTDRDLGQATLETMWRLAQGWALGVAAGTVFGLVTGATRWLEDGVRPVIAGLQSVPTIAFLPLAILWFGFEPTAVLAITAFGTFKPMALTTYGAIRQVPPTLRQAGRAMGARGVFYQRTLVLPAIVPALAVGLKLSWSFAWRSLMAAEIIVSGTPGLGGVLERAREINAIEIVVAVILLIMAIGILFEQLVFARFEKFVNRRWGLAGAR